MPTPSEQRRFAVEVVERLRAAGFEAYFAGGCVRDELLGRTPADYDVATAAEPPQIRELFGRRRTLAIGAAFGVITVIGPKSAGNVEVATFRKDAPYSDGRHPDYVTFSSAEEDARRRDFTINGLFFDPLGRRVLDYVGGQEDLRRGVVRAIGDPRQRFAEDKLRMLRAVRFTAAFGFTLDQSTRAAVAEMAGQITVVSAERIAAEMRRMLVGPRRPTAVRLLIDTGLAVPVLPEILPHDEPAGQRLEENLAVLERLDAPGFPLALAALLRGLAARGGPAPGGVEMVARRWRLSNKETDRAAWILEHADRIEEAPDLPWSVLQPILVDVGIDDLLRLAEATSPRAAEAAAFCRAALARPREQLDPPPLLTGEDLLAHGVAPGPCYRRLLRAARDAQLDGRIATRQEALDLADRLLEQEPGTWNSELGT
jgi:poly(A) polymerase